VSFEIAALGVAIGVCHSYSRFDSSKNNRRFVMFILRIALVFAICMIGSQVADHFFTMEDNLDAGLFVSGFVTAVVVDLIDSMIKGK